MFWMRRCHCFENCITNWLYFRVLWSKSKGGDKGIYTNYGIAKMCGMGGTYESSFEVSHRTLFSFFFHLMVIILSVSVCNFIEIALRHGCSRVNLLHIFRTPFPTNTFEGLLLQLWVPVFWKIIQICIS